MRLPAPTLLRLSLAAALVLGGGGAHGQALTRPPRVYPNGSLMGFAVFGSGPTLSVNCVSYPVGPGLRVETPAQRVLLTGQLAGVRGPAVFQVDSAGNVFRVWLIGPNQVVSGVAKAPGACLFQQF